MPKISAINNSQFNKLKKSNHQKPVIFVIFRSNQELRGSVMQLSDRRLECRVNEDPGSKLKPEVPKMVAELLRLGIPKPSLNVIVKEMLALAEYRVVGLPTRDEVENIEKDCYEDPDWRLFLYPDSFGSPTFHLSSAGMRYVIRGAVWLVQTCRRVWFVG